MIILATRVRLTGFTVLLILVCIGFVSANGAMNLTPSTFITNGTTSVVTVSMDNDNIPTIGSVQFDVQFDPTVIKYESASVVGTSTSTGLISTPAANKVRLTWAAAIGSPLASGYSNLIFITFRAIKPASTSNLNITGLNIYDETGLIAVTTTTTNGTFSVAGLPEWIIPIFTNGTTPTSGQAPLSVDFDATTSDAFGAVAGQYVWDFGDGGSATGFAPTHIFYGA